MTTQVLVLEPERDLAAALSSALGAERATVTVVADHEGALELLRSAYPPHLIVLDLDLPDGAGPELLRILKLNAESRRIPVIVLTAADDPATIDEAWDLFANCVIRKPASTDDLKRIIAVLSTFWLRLALLPRGHYAQAARSQGCPT
jgi:DNA-binding response OmpR family regulator